MNYARGFEVKAPEKQIVLTKDFARKVSDITSAEYTTFMQLRAAYPTFAVVKYTIDQKKEREHYGKLSYKVMATLISEWEEENAEAALEALGELNGKSIREDLVATIFSRFCVGK